ncbi:MAG TPA: exodeoxyribonuclease V subunit alpha, partial [Mizugakiibacter sp.]
MAADLLERLHGGGFLRDVDAALGRTVLRLFPDSDALVGAAAALAARAVADGHAALALDALPQRLAAFAPGRTPPSLPPPEAWRDALRASAAVAATDAPRADALLELDAADRVYLARYARYERELAADLAARATAPAIAVDADAAARLRARFLHDGEAADRQALAALLALRGRLAVITGGPGTGKTTTVTRLLALLAEVALRDGAALRMRLAAPTGKAAARLAEAVRAQRAKLALPAAVAAQIPEDAATVHRLLGAQPGRTRFRHDRARPLDADVVVVDEVSMVDLPLMAKLVAAVPPTARLILLGDPDQLAAVEAGDVLGAIADAADAGGYSAAVADLAERTLGASVPRAAQPSALADAAVALTHSHRFAAAGGIGRLAAAIRAGDADAALAALRAHDDARLLDVPARELQPRLLARALDGYAGLLEARSPGEALDAAQHFRVLTALRRGPAGSLALNHAIEAALKRRAGIAAASIWWPGRLVLIAENSYALGLYNGDLGV